MSSYEVIMKLKEREKFWYSVDRINRKDIISALYSESSLNYYEKISQDKGQDYRDISFCLTYNKTPFMIFFGAACEKDQTVKAYEINTSFICQNLTKSQISFAKKYIYNTFSKLGRMKIHLRDELSQGVINEGTRILNAQYICEKEKVVYTSVIDLKKNLEELKRSLRKSYKPLISWGERELRTEIYDNSNVTWGVIEEFRKLHQKQAGRKTRKVETWKLQYDAIKNNEAFCICGYLEDKLVTAGYFLKANKSCYYGSSASDRSLFDKPLFHVILWNAILYAKEKRLMQFEVGLQYNCIANEERPSMKELDIAKFKKGFGGIEKVYLDRIYINSAIN